ncbi:MAG: hypothetical protein ACO1Q7_05285 [Gemmatimonas sp.]
MQSRSSTHSAKKMIAKHLRLVTPRRIAGAALLSVSLLSGCRAEADGLLDVTDPDILNPDDVSNSGGANPLRFGALKSFVDAYNGGTGSVVGFGGSIADELRGSDTFDERLLPNRRDMNENVGGSPYNALHSARASMQNAIAIIKVAAPTPVFNIGELYMFRGYTEDFFAEIFCSGVPFSEVTENGIIYGTPETTAQTFTRAVASFDSALTRADTSKRVLYGAAVGKARALLNLGRYADAAAAVAAVPTTFTLNIDHCNNTGCTENGMYGAASAPSSRQTPANKEGINGLEFLPTVPDPRLPWVASNRSGFSTQWTNMPIALKICPAYRNNCPGTFNTTGAITLADGIEARLIEAEAKLQSQTQADRDAVLIVLNQLRATGIPGKPITALTSAQTTHAAAVSQLFAERAYWMYMTGHRLGDLRRLVRNYGRDPETVFPTGEQAPPMSGPYGKDVNAPIPAAERNNPNFKGCLDRKA